VLEDNYGHDFIPIISYYINFKPVKDFIAWFLASRLQHDDIVIELSAPGFGAHTW